MYFTEGRTDLPREAIGPEGSNCFLKGVRTRIVLRKTIVTCDFSGRLGPNPLSHFPLGPPMILAFLYSGSDKMEPYQIATTEDRSTIDNVPYDSFYCYLSRGMRFPTMWYVRPSKAQTILRIRAV